MIFNSHVSEIKLVYITQTKYRPSISSSEEAYNIFKAHFDLDTIELKESFWAMYLNRANKVMFTMMHTIGSTHGTVVDVSHVILPAIKINASGIIVAHNHPSGSLNPSEQDKRLTNKIKDALEVHDKKLFDHIIMTKEEYFSFADNSML